jgi:peptide/nickel transport system permease protein
MVLVGVSTLFALAVAIPIGMAQAVRRNRPFDYGMTAVTFILYAMPAFLAGELLIIFFSFTLNWLPSQPPTDASAWAVLTNPVPFILPILTLSALEIAAFSRYMRSAMLDTLTEDYIRTAKAKGASSRRVLWGHALRNAILPILTLIGLTLPAVVGGALITEAIFNYPGMGLLTVQAASNDDVPLVLGTTLVATIATVLGSLLADLLYAAADPRIRLGEQ